MATLQSTAFSGTTNTLTLPSGTTAERPASPAEGMIRYNTTLLRVEVFMNNSWEDAADPVANTKCYLPLFGTADGDITDTVSSVVANISGGTRNYTQSSYAGWQSGTGDAYIDIMTPFIRTLDGNPFWTIEFWVYKTGGVGGSAETMVELCHYTRGLLYRSSSSAQNSYWRGSGIDFSTFPSNSWVHHAIVGYGANIKAFQNGTQVADTMNGVGVSRFADPITTGGTDYCRIGRSNHTTGQYTNGTFRKFKISNKARYLANFTSSTEYPL
jgi:hypothetical protein